jgi:DNA-binding MarR family transcriptional regulator
MCDRLPLPTLLSQVLVAFTVEFDNEYERRMPHRTTAHGSTPGSPDAPWLVSLAMCENCMRFVGEQGVTVRALGVLARTATNLNGMQRWGYIRVKPDPLDARWKPPRGDWVICATPAGRKAWEIWQPLFGEIEKRWAARFGGDEIDRLRESLWSLIGQFTVELPDCLPILGYGLFSTAPEPVQPASARPQDDVSARRPLSALLSRVLVAFAVDFERESDLSLAISANVLRVLDEQGVRFQDLGRLSGVSMELIKSSVGWLEKRHYLVIERDRTARGAKLVRLTAKGQKAQAAYRQRIRAVEDHWVSRFGKKNIDNLRGSLERLVGNPAAQSSPLFEGLEPDPTGWRAAVARPEALPHYPMVTHRGGFPDGS